jgi:hypothetical protein
MNRDTKNSEDYLNNLSKDKKQFSVPENYFNSVEDSVFSKIIEKQLPGKLTYTVPDYYFENFEDTFFSTSEFAKKEVKVIRLKSRILNSIPAAAAACMLLFVGLNYFSTNEETSFETISSEELELWFHDSNLEDNSRDLLEFVDADLKENTIIEDDTSINDDDILEYLNTLNNNTLLTEIES